MGNAWPWRQYIISDEAIKNPEQRRYSEKKEKLITVNGQNPHIEETEEGKGETKDKKDKTNKVLIDTKQTEVFTKLEFG